MPPVLREIVGDQEHQYHLPPGPRRPGITRARHELDAERLGGQRDQPHHHGKEHRDRGIEPIVLRCGVGREESADHQLGKGEPAVDDHDGEQLHGLEVERHIRAVGRRVVPAGEDHRSPQ
jgi:hypothetical protein